MIDYQWIASNFFGNL